MIQLEIKIFVVETKVKQLPNEVAMSLECTKIELIKLFGGLTELEMKGYWVNETDEIETDIGKLWIIYTEIGYEKVTFDRLRKILHRIKDITVQHTQFYTIDSEPHYI